MTDDNKKIKEAVGEERRDTEVVVYKDGAQSPGQGLNPIFV